MDDLAVLVETLSEIRRISNDILEKMLPIMEQITEDDNDIVGEVIHDAEIEENEAVEYLEQITLEIISDSESIRKEMDSFAKYVVEGKKELADNISNYPFFANIWYGDAYDGFEGVSALQMLLKELKEDQTKTNEDWIIENSVKKLAKLA